MRQMLRRIDEADAIGGIDEADAIDIIDVIGGYK